MLPRRHTLVLMVARLMPVMVVPAPIVSVRPLIPIVLAPTAVTGPQSKKVVLGAAVPVPGLGVALVVPVGAVVTTGTAVLVPVPTGVVSVVVTVEVWAETRPRGANIGTTASARAIATKGKSCSTRLEVNLFTLSLRP
jgi:hypothetical protein